MSETKSEAATRDEILAPRDGGTPASRAASWRRRWGIPALEAALAVAAAGAMVVASLSIDVNPLDRMGQVSGIATIDLYFTVAAIALVGCLSAAARWRPGAAFDLTSRLSCAVISGLVSGIVASGVVVALHGTPWCLFGDLGDVGRLALWADWVRDHKAPPSWYPPLPIRSLALYADFFDLRSGFALKHLQILGTAMFGPISYLSWRLHFRPIWALGIGVVAALPLIDPYKPYANLVLIAFVPLLISFLRSMRDSATAQMGGLAFRGALFGGAFGVLCLFYAAWFQWSGPGAVVAGLLLLLRGSSFPKCVGFVAVAAGTFALLTAPYLWAAHASGFRDDFVYFDVYTEPAYVAMWRWDFPGKIWVWPPPGELGNVGLFTLLLAIGLGVAIALGRRHTLVTGVACIMTSAWILRFWHAHRMAETKLVQLYPRTSIQILHCLLILCGYAVFLVVTRRARASTSGGVPASPSVLIGAVCALLLFLGSAGSSIADRYMPDNSQPYNLGWLAWMAHETKTKVP